MRQKLVPGAELDIATPGEVAAMIRGELAEISRRRIRGGGQGKTDANGNLDAIALYTVPPGMEFELNRLLVVADGITAAVGFTSGPNAALEVRRSGQLIDFWTGALGTLGKLNLPASIAWGAAIAPILRNGEVLQVDIIGSPAGLLASAMVTVAFQGRLFARAEE